MFLMVEVVFAVYLDRVLSLVIKYKASLRIDTEIMSAVELRLIAVAEIASSSFIGIKAVMLEVVFVAVGVSV